jgi:hypothetical protein
MGRRGFRFLGNFNLLTGRLIRLVSSRTSGLRVALGSQGRRGQMHRCRLIRVRRSRLRKRGIKALVREATSTGSGNGVQRKRGTGARRGYTASGYGYVIGSRIRYPVFSIEFSARLTRAAVPSTPCIAVRLFEIYGGRPPGVDACRGRIDQLSRKCRFSTEFAAPFSSYSVAPALPRFDLLRAFTLPPLVLRPVLRPLFQDFLPASFHRLLPFTSWRLRAGVYALAPGYLVNERRGCEAISELSHPRRT